MNCFMDKLHLMVKIKEKIYELSSNPTEKDEVARLKKLLEKVQREPHRKYI